MSPRAAASGSQPPSQPCQAPLTQPPGLHTRPDPREGSERQKFPAPGPSRLITPGCRAPGEGRAEVLNRGELRGCVLETQSTSIPLMPHQYHTSIRPIPHQYPALLQAQGRFGAAAAVWVSGDAGCVQGEGLSSFPSCAPGLSWPLPQAGLAQPAPLTPPVSEFIFQSLFLTLPSERAQTPRSHMRKPLGAAAGGERGAHTSPVLNKCGAVSPSQLQLPVFIPQITQPCAICGVYTFPCSCCPRCCTPGVAVPCPQAVRGH